MTRLLLLELNEINFDHVCAYVRMGKLPVLGRLIDRHGISETTSETHYDELEPWIQWVTAHTGQSLAEHGVFRLGDIVKHEIPQIWEELEDQGLKVGAISPMNASNRCRQPSFFLPDPWTPSVVSGPPLLKKLYEAVSQLVNDNAQSRITPTSAFWLMVSAIAYAQPANYGRYFSLVLAAAKRRSWAKALILDQLLADVFVHKVRQRRPDFGSLFLNAGAHVQHHYMFNSAVYEGPFHNPEWYVSPECDPVLEVYELYDRIVGDVVAAFPDARLILATGLHQDPHDEVTFYWRLRDHAQFLNSLNVGFDRVEPRMSRDFFIVCNDESEAAAAERTLMAVTALDGTPLFDVDNRGKDLFVMLTWPRDIPAGFEYMVGDRRIAGLRDHVAFVAIKNGKHNGIGYVVDTETTGRDAPERFPLSDMPQRIAAACGVPWLPA